MAYCRYNHTYKVYIKRNRAYRLYSFLLVCIYLNMSEIIAEGDIEVGVFDFTVVPFFLVSDIHKSELIVDAKIYSVECISEANAEATVKTLDTCFFVFRTRIGATEEVIFIS